MVHGSQCRLRSCRRSPQVERDQPKQVANSEVRRSPRWATIVISRGDSFDERAGSLGRRHDSRLGNGCTASGQEWPSRHGDGVGPIGPRVVQPHHAARPSTPRLGEPRSIHFVQRSCVDLAIRTVVSQWLWVRARRPSGVSPMGFCHAWSPRGGSHSRSRSHDRPTWSGVCQRCRNGYRRAASARSVWCRCA